MLVKGLEFKETCYASPEQYDVFRDNEEQVGYVRLRWGSLSCEYPDVGGELIYHADIDGCGWTGRFPSDEERMFHLNAIADKINGILNDDDEC